MKLHCRDSPTLVFALQGALVALALDLTIRKGTDGKHSLDDVMHECWARYGETGEGMPERGLESVARSVSGLDFEDFFERFGIEYYLAAGKDRFAGAIDMSFVSNTQLSSYFFAFKVPEGIFTVSGS